MKIGEKYTVVKECHVKSYHGFVYRTEVICTGKSYLPDHYEFRGIDRSGNLVEQALDIKHVRAL